MVSAHEQRILDHIRRQYATILRLAARMHGHRTEVLAGIMARETQGGLSPLLSEPGPWGKGDRDKTGHWHGHGLMQIDDRSFPEFCASPTWGDPRTNIDMAARVLASKRRYISGRPYGRQLTPPELERAAIAAYNAGEGRVMTCVTSAQDVDTYTAHGNYSREVLRLAEAYAEAAAHEVTVRS
jgi:hypothetical protein